MQKCNLECSDPRTDCCKRGCLTDDEYVVDCSKMLLFCYLVHRRSRRRHRVFSSRV